MTHLNQTEAVHTSETLLEGMESDAACPCCSFLCMSVKGERETAKVEILHHHMRHLLQNTAACFRKGKTGTQSANILCFGSHWLQTRAILPLFHGWFVSFGGKSLYRLSKTTYLVWNRTKWDLIPVSTVFIPLPERARVSLKILQIWKMLKNPSKPKQTGKLTHIRFLGLLGLRFLCLRLQFQLTHYYCSTWIISSQTSTASVARALCIFPSFVLITGEVL